MMVILIYSLIDTKCVHYFSSSSIISTFANGEPRRAALPSGQITCKSSLSKSSSQSIYKILNSQLAKIPSPYTMKNTCLQVTASGLSSITMVPGSLKTVVAPTCASSLSGVRRCECPSMAELVLLWLLRAEPFLRAPYGCIP